jgi:hypothetical protein
MHITTRFAALALGASIITGAALAAPAGAATKPPTVQQVQDQEQLIAAEDTRAGIRAWVTFDPETAQSACQAQVDHVAALSAMVRPKRYPKATWKILMRGADLFAKAASECVAASQAALASHDASTYDTYTSAYKQTKPEWDEASSLFDKANNALAKAKIR